MNKIVELFENAYDDEEEERIKRMKPSEIVSHINT